MLNNRIVFERLIALLESIEPGMKLPEDMKEYLWKYMIAHTYCTEPTRFEQEGETPKNAYYVVRGFVIVYGYNQELKRYVFRIYGENTIVAMHCFMEQEKSEYCIWACKDTLLWSISAEHMDHIYKKWDMKDFAWRTASKHNTAREKFRSWLLGMEDIEMRVLEFYKRYLGLLPPKKSPIRDACVACFLNITVVQLRNARGRLKAKKLLKY